MEQHVSQMMPAGIEPEQLAVQHVGKGGERVPMPDLGMGERPDAPIEGQALRDLGIQIDGFRIVVIDELEPKRLAEDDPD